jgi:cysteine-rich repeat protein
MALLGFAAVAVPACSSDTGGANGGGSCVPGQTASCACTDGAEGVQTCKNGSYGSCDCSGGLGGGGGGGAGGPCNHGSISTCGNGMKEGTELCDDGNCVNDDACTNACAVPYCGDKIVQEGEDCDDGQNEVGDECPDNCQIDMCAGKPVFVALTAQTQVSEWGYMGKIGYEAGTAMCKALGATNVCDYTQLKEILDNPMDHKADIEKMKGNVLPGSQISIWVNRTTPEMVNGVNSMHGPGGRCNDWAYSSNDKADGEYLTLTNNGGTLTHAFTLDADTVFTGIPNDGHAGPGLDCGTASRYIACCFAKCVP